MFLNRGMAPGRVQNESAWNMPPWNVDYFELKTTKPKRLGKSFHHPFNYLQHSDQGPTSDLYGVWAGHGDRT